MGELRAPLSSFFWEQNINNMRSATICLEQKKDQLIGIHRETMK